MNKEAINLMNEKIQKLVVLLCMFEYHKYQTHESFKTIILKLCNIL